MFEKFKNNVILYPTAIMLAICLVVTAALAGTNALTKKKIADINAENEAKAMARVLKAKTYTEKKLGDGTYYIAENGDEAVGYVFKKSKNGYGGTVSVMVGINADGSVNKVEVLDVTSETPGLGQNTAKEDFLKQYKKITETVTAKKYGTANGDGEIDAVASATITSTAVTDCVNSAIKDFKKISKENGGDGNE